MSTNTTKADLSVANEIKRQLFSINRNEVYCWGAHNWCGVEDDGKSMLGALIFSVQNTTQLKKGIVKIELNAMDLYDIFIYDNKNNDYQNFAEAKGIYCDMLVDVIHNLIDS